MSKKILNFNNSNQAIGYQAGLTWVEIIFFTSVVSFMAVLICATVSNASLRGRDAKSILAVKEFSTTIELYRLKNAEIPQLYGYIDGRSPTYMSLNELLSDFSYGPLLVLGSKSGNGEYNNTSQTSDYSVGDNDPMTYSLRFVSTTGNIYCLTSSQIFQVELGEGRESKCVQG